MPTPPTTAKAEQPTTPSRWKNRCAKDAAGIEEFFASTDELRADAAGTSVREELIAAVSIGSADDGTEARLDGIILGGWPVMVARRCRLYWQIADPAA